LNITIDTKGLDEISAKIDALPNKFVAQVLARTVSKLRQKAPADTGQLAQSGRHKMTGYAEGEIVFSTNYARYVHDGRGAGGVDFFAIKDWIKSKGIDQRAAWPIAQSIRKKGTKKQPWVNNFIESTAMKLLIKKEAERVAKNVA